MHIRTEKPGDWPAVHALITAAFGTSTEADLVDDLRQQAHPIISLVAELDQTIVGHILFSPVTLSGHPDLQLMGLAPMAVAPVYQRQGVGSALVREGLVRCTDLGAGAAVVLGHPDYYPRFGFTPAVKFGIRCEFEAPHEAFMIVELKEAYLNGQWGTIHYNAVFDVFT